MGKYKDQHKVFTIILITMLQMYTDQSPQSIHRIQFLLTFAVYQLACLALYLSSVLNKVLTILISFPESLGVFGAFHLIFYQVLWVLVPGTETFLPDVLALYCHGSLNLFEKHLARVGPRNLIVLETVFLLEVNRLMNISSQYKKTACMCYLKP